MCMFYEDTFKGPNYTLAYTLIQKNIKEVWLLNITDLHKLSFSFLLLIFYSKDQSELLQVSGIWNPQDPGVSKKNESG